ncbi:MAG TPA: SMI1/KNR4 family protein [Chitinophagaceae bacterium]
MNDLLNKYFSDPLISEDYAESNIFYPPAQIAVISSVEKSLGINFPQDYVDFLLTTNGYDGKLGESYSVFTQIEKVEEYSSNYRGQAFPWAIYIGTDGGNEMYIIDTRSPKYNFGLLPYIGEESDFINLGSTFEEFVRHLYYNDFWPTKNSI